MTQTEVPPVAIVFTGTDFYLRVEKGNGVHQIELEDNVTLPGARKAARALGFEPTVWIAPGGRVNRFYS